MGYTAGIEIYIYFKEKPTTQTVNKIYDMFPTARNQDINNTISFDYYGEFNEDALINMLKKINETEPMKTCSIDITEENCNAYAVEYEPDTNTFKKYQKHLADICKWENRLHDIRCKKCKHIQTKKTPFCPICGSQMVNYEQNECEHNYDSSKNIVTIDNQIYKKCPTCGKTIKIDTNASLFAIALADDSKEHTKEYFSDEFPGKSIKEYREYNNLYDFINAWKRLKDNPRSQWYWILHNGETIISGAIDSDDITGICYSINQNIQTIIEQKLKDEKYEKNISIEIKNETNEEILLKIIFGYKIQKDKIIQTIDSICPDIMTKIPTDIDIHNEFRDVSFVFSVSDAE